MDMSERIGGLPDGRRDAVISRLREAPVSVAVLFGSRATGDATAGSDIDIAVSYEGTAAAAAHFSLVADLTRILGRDDVDVARIDTVDPRIAVDALTHGEILVGSADDAARLRDGLDDERQQRETEVSNRIDDAKRAIDRRIERRGRSL